MVKSPMEYFESQDFSPATAESISPAEAAFIQKYLGIEVGAASSLIAPARAETIMEGTAHAKQSPAVQSVAPEQQAQQAQQAQPEQQKQQEQLEQQEQRAPAQPSSTTNVSNLKTALNTGPGADYKQATADTPSTPAHSPVQPPEIVQENIPTLPEVLRSQEQVTMVGFYLCGQVFVLPIDSIVEVIRYEQPSKLPRSSEYLLGVINLRGHITPVVSLSKLLVLPEDQEICKENAPKLESTIFIICESQGLHIGLHIDKLHTMHKATPNQIEWNAETQLGESAALLLGLFETGENLLGIVSVDKIVQALLTEEF